MNTHQPTRAEGRRRASRKLAAVLAGGLVASVGTAATLASWNDSEYASASFTAGRFDLEGSLDAGTTYSQHSAAGAAAALTFTLPTNNLSPGDMLDASFPVRLAAGTTHNAELKVTKAASTGALTGIGVIAWQNTTSNCTGAYNSATMLAFADSGTLYPGIRPTMTKGATSAVAGAPVYVCFRMMAGDNLPQGQTGSFTWQITATSVAQ